LPHLEGEVWREAERSVPVIVWHPISGRMARGGRCQLACWPS